MNADTRGHRNSDGSMIDWTREASFNFDSEVDALETLAELGDELRSAREQVREVTRYLQAAVIAAREQADTSPTAIINHAGLARQTVYTMLGQS